jgi:hypothetical protein
MFPARSWPAPARILASKAPSVTPAPWQASINPRMIRFGQDASAYGAPGPLVDMDHIGSGLLFSLVRATGNRPVPSPVHRDCPSANSVVSAVSSTCANGSSPPLGQQPLSRPIAKCVNHRRRRPIGRLPASHLDDAKPSAHAQSAQRRTQIPRPVSAPIQPAVRKPRETSGTNRVNRTRASAARLGGRMAHSPTSDNTKTHVSPVELSPQQLPGHDHALDLTGALVDLGDLGCTPSDWRQHALPRDTWGNWVDSHGQESIEALAKLGPSAIPDSQDRSRPHPVRGSSVDLALRPWPSVETSGYTDRPEPRTPSAIRKAG